MHFRYNPCQQPNGNYISVSTLRSLPQCLISVPIALSFRTEETPLSELNPENVYISLMLSVDLARTSHLTTPKLKSTGVKYSLASVWSVRLRNNLVNSNAYKTLDRTKNSVDVWYPVCLVLLFCVSTWAVRHRPNYCSSPELWQTQWKLTQLLLFFFSVSFSNNFLIQLASFCITKWSVGILIMSRVHI